MHIHSCNSVTCYSMGGFLPAVLRDEKILFETNVLKAFLYPFFSIK
ncbi:hypothetical protein KP77_16350 [Jeotgalibacillus alimentarius]|uniref:Uncharacterized protein n=1 Tax=Jeotgalibacillus alimentarius TaxID=135826 RepID=A0A0C2RJ99_9BACL|nr:hypothetical protein KP77_16350 [Jeotgalibacillus alimentarius]